MNTAVHGRRLALGAAALLLCGCGLSPGIDVGGPLALAETVPGLIDSAGAVVFSLSTQESCRTLVDASAERLDDIVAAEPHATQQRIPLLRGLVDVDRDGDFEDHPVEHTFGAVPANIPVSFLFWR
jgi:hypothetical protein